MATASTGEWSFSLPQGWEIMLSNGARTYLVIVYYSRQ